MDKDILIFFIVLVVALLIAVPLIILANPPFNNWNNFTLIIGLEAFLFIILIVLFIYYVRDRLKEKYKELN